MGFLIQCDNKKCREYQEPLLDKETNLAHCAKCDGVINNISIFTKRQMSAMGQIKREEVPKQAFAIKCNFCEKIMCPKLETDNKKDKIVCPSCGKTHVHLSPPYAQTVIAFLKKAL